MFSGIGDDEWDGFEKGVREDGGGGEGCRERGDDFEYGEV